MANKIIFGGKVCDTQFDWKGKTVAKFIYNGKECVLAPAWVSINSYTGTFRENTLKVAFSKIDTTVTDGQFRQEDLLTTISMPEVISVGSNGFYYAKLTSIDLPKVQTIGSYAFYNSFPSDSLHNPATYSLSLPAVTQIGDYAFTNGRNIAQLIAPNLITIGTEAFQKSKLTVINIPNANNIGDRAFSWVVNFSTTKVTMKSKFNNYSDKNRIFGTNWNQINFTWV